MPGVSQPALPHDAPAATPSRSMTVTSTPRSWRNHAVARPTIPAPTTAMRWGAGEPAGVTAAMGRLLVSAGVGSVYLHDGPPQERPFGAGAPTTAFALVGGAPNRHHRGMPPASARSPASATRMSSTTPVGLPVHQLVGTLGGGLLTVVVEARRATVDD